MPSSRQLSAVALILLIVIAVAPAQPTRADAPTAGPWKARPPGTFVVMQVVAATPPVDANTAFHRDVLLGTDAAGHAWFGSDIGPSPTGPWTPQGGHGESSIANDFPVTTTPLGRRDLVIAGKPYPCEVVREEITYDASISTTDTWTEVATGLTLRTKTDARPRDADGPPPSGSREEIATTVETRTVAGVDMPAFVLDGRQTFGKRSMSTRTVISDHIAGNRLAFSRWDNADRAGPPTYAEVVVQVGVDTEALKSHPLWPAPKTDADTLAEFVEKALADLKSPDARVRAGGVGTLGMNHYAAADRPRVEAAIRAALSDKEAEVRRAAAVAAGNRLRGIAPTLVSMAAGDPGGLGNYIEALGAAADPAGLQVILPALTTRDRMIAGRAVFAASQIWDDRVDAALSRLAASPDAHVRGELARTLARGRNQNGVDLLMRAAADPQKSVRWPAFLSLAERGDPRSFDVAVAGLRDTDADVRQSALFAVMAAGRGDRAKTVDVLAATIADAGAARLHLSAAMGLASFGDERAIPTFGRMLSRPDDFKDAMMMGPPDAAAVHGLMTLGTPAAIRVLIDHARTAVHPETVLDALRRKSSPAIARAAWAWRTEALAAGGPATRRAAGDFRGALTDQLRDIAVAGADRALRDEIEASIPAAPPMRRPYLRAAVREIDKRLAKR